VKISRSGTNSPKRRALQSRALWAITAYFNPGGYRQRLANYRVFRRRLDVPLVAVELSYGDDFELTKSDADVLVQLRGGDVMWQKERLLNIALSALPASCSKVAWIDSDVVFASSDWVRRTQRRLDKVPLLQPFSRAHYLPQGIASGRFTPRRAESSRVSVACAAAAGMPVSGWLKNQPKPRVALADKPAWAAPAVGLAWAARRDVLDRHGFYDGCIIGGGDRALILAANGDFADLMKGQSMSRAQRRSYLKWAQAFHETVGTADRYVEGDVFHLWHGSRTGRSYEDRHARLKPFAFSPARDIAISQEGAWRWNSDKPGLHACLEDYFQGRREDG